MVLNSRDISTRRRARHGSSLTALLLTAVTAVITATAGTASAQPAGAPRPLLYGFALECDKCGPAPRDASDVAAPWRYAQPPRVVAVAPGGAAARAGVREGDSVTAVDGLSLLTAEGARRFSDVHGGDRVRLTLQREGKAIDLPITLTAVPSAHEGTSCLTAGTKVGDRTSSHSSMNGDRDVGKRWTVSWSAANCQVDFRVDGTALFRTDFSDVESITPGGRVEISVEDGSSRRRLTVRPLNGTLTREWTVQGRSQPWNDEARSWLSGILIDLDRRTAFAIDLRYPQLIANGGPGAVLDELSRFTFSYARAAYLLRLVDSTSLDTRTYRRLLGELGGESNPDRDRVLLAIAKKSGLDDEGVRIDYLHAARGLSSPYERSRALMPVLDKGRLSHPVAEALFEVLSGSMAGPDLPRIVQTLIDRDMIEKEDVAGAIGVAGHILATPDRAQILIAFAGRYHLEGDARRAYLRVADGIPSAVERARVLEALLKQE
jgi:hypothetical protein